MLSLSPPLFSTNYGWPLVDDLVFADNHIQQYNNGVSIANSYLDFPTYDQILHHNFPTEDQTSISSGGGGDGPAGSHEEALMVAKKLNHNASERNRRKRVNNFYAFLRSLLPVSSDHHRTKVSIPGTVSLALNYIPQLQKEVETLIHKKERLLSSSSSLTRHELVEIGNQSANKGTNQRKSSVMIPSVIVLDENEVVIQLISSTDDCKNKNNEMGFLSKALEFLEEEEDGLILLNANTLKWYGDKTRFLNTFHFQVEGNHKIEAEKLKEKLCSFYQESCA